MVDPLERIITHSEPRQFLYGWYIDRLEIQPTVVCYKAITLTMKSIDFFT